MNTSKPANVSRIPPLILLKPSKEVLVKSKFYKGKGKTREKPKYAPKEYSYAQMSKSSIKEIVKIKNNLLNLSAKKIEKVCKVLNKPRKNKPKLNMIIKGLSRRQVIISMSLNNSQKFMSLFNKHISNINRTLKDIKSDIIADFIHTDNIKLTITTNKVTSILNLNIIKKYIKNVDNIDLEDVILLRLPQSKSYFRILNILYLIKNTNVPISTDIVEKVLYLSHIFNNIILTSKPHAIKVSLKSDMSVI